MTEGKPPVSYRLQVGASPLSRRGVRLTAVLAVAVAAGLGAWLGTRSGGGEPRAAKPGRTATLGPVAARDEQTVPVTAQGLRTLAGALEQPIYWAGNRAGVLYELTRTKDGRIYVRYLPHGAKIGSARRLLTVATYPLADAFSVTEAVAGRAGSVRVPVGSGGVAFYNRTAPTNVYLAYPGSDFQIEVFDPSAAEARRLVSSGHVAPVPPARILTPSAPGSAGVPATVVSAAGLRTFARTAGHPVYWAGARSGRRYEISETAQGRIFVRYLPPGQPAGSSRPYLTVGTYPLQDALAVTRGEAGRAGAVRVPAGDGAVAFYARSRPTNVYLAFPRVGYQVEVYDPSAAEAKRLVTSGRITPVG
ncbi:MAG TPA: hypothetical protein VFA44_13535 [Gaiellaceae bacterium]|nr:hypothetical protein [Gaiellaceae bacterium]